MKRSASRKARGRVFLWIERLSLGVGMSVMVFFIERRLLRTIKAGGVKTRPEAAPAGPEREAQLATAPNQVRHKAKR
jgi:hypothetical protein